MDFEKEIGVIANVVNSASSAFDRLDPDALSDAARSVSESIDRIAELRSAIDEELESRTMALVEETRELAGSRRVDVYERIESAAKSAKEIASLATQASSLMARAQRVVSLAGELLRSRREDVG